MNVNQVVLDVREHLRKKLEPFELIMNTVKNLSPTDVFVLHATFKPVPLLGVMMAKGYKNKVKQVDTDHWVVTFVHKSQAHLLDSIEVADTPEVKPQMAQGADTPAADAVQAAGQGKPAGKGVYTLDNRGLEPPQPMMRTLAQLEKMASGETLVIINDRVPVFLIEELNQLGYTYETEEWENGAAKVTIRKP